MKNKRLKKGLKLQEAFRYIRMNCTSREMVLGIEKLMSKYGQGLVELKLVLEPGVYKLIKGKEVGKSKKLIYPKSKSQLIMVNQRLRIMEDGSIKHYRGKNTLKDK